MILDWNAKTLGRASALSGFALSDLGPARRICGCDGYAWCLSSLTYAQPRPDRFGTFTAA